MQVALFKHGIGLQSSMFISHWCPAKPAWQVHLNAFTCGEIKESMSKRRGHAIAVNYTHQTGICLTSVHSVNYT